MSLIKGSAASNPAAATAAGMFSSADLAHAFALYQSQLGNLFGGRKKMADNVRAYGVKVGALGGLPRWEDFYTQFEDLYVKLNGVNHMLLRFRP